MCNTKAFHFWTFFFALKTMENKIVTIREAALILGVKEMTLRQYFFRKKICLPKHTISGVQFFNLEDIKKLLPIIEALKTKNKKFLNNKNSKGGKSK